MSTYLLYSTGSTAVAGRVQLTPAPTPPLRLASAPGALQKTQVVERPDLDEGPPHDGVLVDRLEERRVPGVLAVVAEDPHVVARDLLGWEVPGADVGR